MRYFLCRHNHGLVTVPLLFVCAYMHSDTFVGGGFRVRSDYGSLLVTKMTEVERCNAVFSCLQCQ